MPNDAIWSSDASRVEADSSSRGASKVTVSLDDAPAVAAILDRYSIRPIQKEAALRGIADKIVVYELP